MAYAATLTESHRRHLAHLGVALIRMPRAEGTVEQGGVRKQRTPTLP